MRWYAPIAGAQYADDIMSLLIGSVAVIFHTTLPQQSPSLAKLTRSPQLEASVDQASRFAYIDDVGDGDVAHHVF
jgi:hypothetical protein